MTAEKVRTRVSRIWTAEDSMPRYRICHKRRREIGRPEVGAATLFVQLSLALALGLSSTCKRQKKHDPGTSYEPANIKLKIRLGPPIQGTSFVLAYLWPTVGFQDHQ